MEVFMHLFNYWMVMIDYCSNVMQMRVRKYFEYLHYED